MSNRSPHVPGQHPAPDDRSPQTNPAARPRSNPKFTVLVLAIIAVIAVAICLRADFATDTDPDSPVRPVDAVLTLSDATYAAYYDELQTIRPLYFQADAAVVALDASSLRQFIPLSRFTNYGGAISSDGTVFLLGYGDLAATTALPTTRDDSAVVYAITGLDFPEEWSSHCFWVYPYTLWESYLVYDYDETVPHQYTEGGQDAGLWSYSLRDGFYERDADLTGELYYLSVPNLPSRLA